MTTPTFSIDPARPGDEAVIVEMIRELAAYEKLERACHITPEMLARHLFGERPTVEGDVVRCEGEPAGYILYFTTFSSFVGKPGLFLEDLYVRPAYRRRGIGGACLKHVARLCRERDYGRMEWTALTWNELALSQYRKIGAVPLEDWRMWRLTGDALKIFGEA